MSPYEAAVKMYLREQDRWNQWVLFFFGAVVSIFVTADKLLNMLKDGSPYIVGLSLFFAILVSLLWVGAGIGLRRSSKAWHQTLKQIEAMGPRGMDSARAFEIYENTNLSIRKGSVQKRETISQDQLFADIKDELSLCRLLKPLDTKVRTSVSGALIRLGVLAVLFLSVTLLCLIMVWVGDGVLEKIWVVAFLLFLLFPLCHRCQKS